MFNDRTSLFTTIYPEINDWRQAIIALVIVLAVWLGLGCFFYYTGTVLWQSALGGFLLLAIALSGAWPELLASISLTLMLKVGSPTVAALIGPWGGKEALEETVEVINTTGFPQLVLGFLILLFFVVMLPLYIVQRWKE